MNLYPLNTAYIKKVSLWLYFLVGFWGVGSVSYAQNHTGGSVCRNFYLSAHDLVLDTGLVSPLGMVVQGLPDSAWSFNMQKRSIKLRSGHADGVYTVCFRLLAVPINKPVFLRSILQRDSTRIYQDVAIRPPEAADRRVELFALPGIQKSGSLSRGVSFGNSQGLFVNSALNLQLQGQLAQGITLTALINDQQLPFQPQGNTAQVRELDRILIQLDHKNAQLQAGDVVLTQQPSQFLRYYKNVQGARLRTTFGRDSLHQAITTVGAAVAKGKFASIVVPPIEGVQGPYRLRTPTNEAFIVIQANSERVYIDNELKQRGFNRDYVIDYNTGEVTFTPRVLITRYTRIRVDFEYAERNYSRGILEANHYQRLGRVKAHVNFYQEQDDANRPISFAADDAVRATLAAAADTLARAVISGAVPVTEFSTDQVLYVKRDTTTSAGKDSIFVYTPAIQPNLFSVSFTDVGAGNGDYVLASTLANGRVFRWVGRRQGAFLPLRRVATPNRRRMLTAGASLQLGNGHTVGTEAAISDYNANLYAGEAISRRGDAQHLYYKSGTQALGNDWQLNTGLDLERLSKSFTAIDRFRGIEFDRDWSASGGDTLPADDLMGTLQYQLNKGATFKWTGRTARRTKGTNVNGIQLDNQWQAKLLGFDVKAQQFFLDNQRPTTRSTWQRWAADVSYPLRGLVPGIALAQDRNAVSLTQKDSVVQTAMFFDEQKVYVRTADSLKTKFGLEAANRLDYLPWEGRMRAATSARTVQASTSHRAKSGNYVSITTAYRVLEVVNLQDTLLAKRPREETVQGRLDWIGDYAQRHIRTELTVATGVGRELQREYRYVRVANPQDGTHQWIDLNGDGQQQLDEFVEAARPEDRLYIKIFVPTTVFVNAYSTNINYKLTFRMPTSWATRGWYLKQLGKLSGNLGYTLDRRLLNPAVWQRFTPFERPADNDLLSNAQNLRANLYYNRTEPSYGAELTYQNTQRRTFLTSGFEEAIQRDLRGSVRSLIGMAWNATVSAASINRVAASNFLTNRNYTISGWEAGPELAYQPDSRFRISTQALVSERVNETESLPASIRRIGTEVRLAKAGVRSITGQLRYTSILYAGARTGPATYDMLEGLLPGDNYTWMVNWQQSLFNGLQLLISYDGRKSQGQEPIHIGRVQITALF